MGTEVALADARKKLIEYTMKFESAVSKDSKKKNLLVEALQDLAGRDPVKIGGCCHSEKPSDQPKFNR
mgnify:CR=1 FL=1